MAITPNSMTNDVVKSIFGPDHEEVGNISMHDETTSSAEGSAESLGFTPVNGNGNETPKKSSPKKRLAVDTATANEDNDEELTPKKKRTPAKPKTPKQPKIPKTPKIPNTPKTATAKGAAMPIPKSYEEAGEADRLMVQMRNEDKTWAEIQAMWLEHTGTEKTSASLQKRFSRIKDNLTKLEDGEASMVPEDLMVRLLQNIEAKLANEKWGMLAADMEKEGCKKYGTPFLQKQMKRIEQAGVKANAGSNGSAATRDASAEDEHMGGNGERPFVKSEDAGEDED
ncbi:hypothetical protein MMC25_005791 [Agyrium rufum]|nr:hypothetical protein [Agyrium rufum]